MSFTPVSITQTTRDLFMERVVQTCDAITVIEDSEDEIRMHTSVLSIATALLDDLMDFCSFAECSCLSNDVDRSRRVWEIVGYHYK